MSPIFQEIAALRRRPEEVFDMWSEALLQMDYTLKYQVERMQAENEKLREQSKAGQIPYCRTGTFTSGITE